jgi:two-component system cell cycle sensor histidine kinase/response regulator CckA
MNPPSVTDSGRHTPDEALAALAESEARHQALFENSAAVQLIVDRDSGAIVRANAAAARFYGWPLAALHSMLISDLDGTSPRAWRDLAASGALRDGERMLGTHRIAAGEPRAIEAFPACMTVDSRAVVHFIVCDSGGRAGADAALQAAELHLAMLRQRAGATGHDFNNVLTVLRGATAFLQEAIAPGSASQEDIAALERATDRAEELMRELVELVRRG